MIRFWKSPATCLAASCALVLAAAGAGQAIAAGGIWQLEHNQPEGGGCGGWGSVSYRACMPMARCNSDTVSADDSLKLYDRIDVELDTALTDACAALECRPGEARRDDNHFECVGPGTLCMNRTMEYRCREGAVARRGSRARPVEGGPEPETSPLRAVVIDQAAVSQTMAARMQPADLAFDGTLRIGNREVAWGQIVQLGPDDALDPDDGRCRFRYRYTAINQGEGAAGLHVNRVRIGEEIVIAEDEHDALAPGAKKIHSGTIPLWTGQHVIYAHLDAEEQVNDADRTNNLRRIRADVAEGCADPRPQARAPREGTAWHIPRPTGRHAPPEPEADPARPQARAPREGTTRHIPRPTGRPMPQEPERSGTRAAPPPQGKPAPGTAGKPVADDAADCKPMMSATRHLAATRAGGRASAIAAWEASAIAIHGAGYGWWGSAMDKSDQCDFVLTWRCTVSARPCRG